MAKKTPYTPLPKDQQQSAPKPAKGFLAGLREAARGETHVKGQDPKKPHIRRFTDTPENRESGIVGRVQDPYTKLPFEKGKPVPVATPKGGARIRDLRQQVMTSTLKELIEGDPKPRKKK